MKQTKTLIEQQKQDFNQVFNAIEAAVQSRKIQETAQSFKTEFYEFKTLTIDKKSMIQIYSTKLNSEYTFPESMFFQCNADARQMVKKMFTGLKYETEPRKKKLPQKRRTPAAPPVKQKQSFLLKAFNFIRNIAAF